MATSQTNPGKRAQVAMTRGVLPSKPESPSNAPKPSVVTGLKSAPL